MQLDGKVALVTGAGRGLGWGIARALGRAGARVCVTDINAAELEQATHDLLTDGSDVMTHELDVANLSAWETTVAAVTECWGRLDVLVHNAIYMPLIRLEDTSPDLWWQQLHVSLGGLYNGTHAVWNTMKHAGGGHIIGIASGSSVRGYKDEVTYCTAKHGQEGFVKALALEAAPYGIAINTIGPGKPIKPTGITRDELEQLPAEAKAAWAEPAELGKAFVWLASQPPQRFSGFRFDAGPIVDILAAEGDEFVFAPHKVTLNADDFMARQHWYANYQE